MDQSGSRSQSAFWMAEVTCAKGSPEPFHLVRPAYKSDQSDGVVAEIGAIDEDGREGEERVDDDEEEVRLPRRAARPYTPTKADWDEHLPLHLNYRDWCEDCVRAKAVCAPHRSSTEEPLEGVTWNMDYCFLGDKPEEDILDDEGEEKRKGKLPILVVYDNEKNAFWSLLSTHKGPTESAVKWAVDRLEDSGYIGQGYYNEE